MVNFLGTLQNEWAGAQAFSSFDTYMAPFVKKHEMELRDELAERGAKFPNEKALDDYIDEKVYKYVYQNIQSFVFNMNVPSRWGTQTPFTNVTLDWTCPEDLADQRLMLGGEPFSYTFGELQKEMDIVNRTFIEVMTRGGERGRAFTFPIPTYSITKDFDWENKILEPIFEMTRRFGIPYFANYVNSDMKPDDVRSMCCRLRINNKVLRKRGGLFAANPLTGSLGVVTINLARIGYLAQDKKDFFNRLNRLMRIARDSLLIKRKAVEEFTEKGLYPYCRHYLSDVKQRTNEYWTNHFNTIGINGMNEALINFLGKDIAGESGKAFAQEVMDFMRKKILQYQKSTKQLFNLEATPAEGTSYRFARIDKEKYADIIVANEKDLGKDGIEPFYTNSTHLPVDYTDDIFEAFDHQDELQVKYNGGTVLHGFLGESLDSIRTVKSLIKKIAQNYHLPYFTLTPTFSICPVHGYLKGEHKYCPKCDGEKQACEVYSRIVGYLRPVSQWNPGKEAEFYKRRAYKIKN